jgi:FixJ family two-component response regulator
MQTTMGRNTVLADDHTIVTEGLAGLLAKHDIDVVGAVGDGHLLIDAAKRLRPDVIVTDLSMPGLTALDVLARLRAERIESKIIILTMHHDADVTALAIRGGASGFLPQGIGRRRTRRGDSPGLAGLCLPDARHDERGRGTNYGRLGRGGAAVDRATT